MGELEKIVWVSGAYDKRSTDPKKNHGIGACRITFILKGPLGAVQFMIGTNWDLPDVQRELRARNRALEERFDQIQPTGWDVGYHSPKPMYEGQEPMTHCEIMDPCYYDGSGLRADNWVPDFIAGGTEWLWPKLEAEYRRLFEKAES